VIDITQFGAFLAALVALVASPGPATLALAATSAAFGFRPALPFLVGSICGAALTISLVGSGTVGLLLAHPVAAPVLLTIAAIYMLYLAYRIATAPPLGVRAAAGRAPAFVPGLVLGLTNPKGYAVFATLFSGFTVVPDDIAADAVFKGGVILALLALIDMGWFLAGGALRRLLHDARIARRMNLAFAALLLASVALALAL
jgi:threonine/homoserine/homoserine lactone efflux protein